MKTVEIEKNGEKSIYDIPDKWDDVSVGEYTKIVQFKNKYEGDNSKFGIKESVELVSILTGIDSKTLYLMTPDNFEKLAKSIDFVKTDLDTKNVEFIIIEGEKFWLKKDFDKLTMGEVASVEAIQKKYERLDESLPELLCIFLRKKLDNGKLEDYDVDFHDTRVDLFKKAKISEVNNILSFFLTGKNLLSQNMKESSEEIKIK